MPFGGEQEVSLLALILHKSTPSIVDGVSNWKRCATSWLPSVFVDAFQHVG